MSKLDKLISELEEEGHELESKSYGNIHAIAFMGSVFSLEDVLWWTHEITNYYKFRVVSIVPDNGDRLTFILEDISSD